MVSFSPCCNSYPDIVCWNITRFNIFSDICPWGSKSSSAASNMLLRPAEPLISSLQWNGLEDFSNKGNQRSRVHKNESRVPKQLLCGVTSGWTYARLDVVILKHHWPFWSSEWQTLNMEDNYYWRTSISVHSCI